MFLVLEGLGVGMGEEEEEEGKEEEEVEVGLERRCWGVLFSHLEGEGLKSWLIPAVV